MIRWLACLLLLLSAAGVQAQGAPTFPTFSGLVVDDAGVLPDAVKADLTAKLEALQRDTKRQVVVATIRDLQGYPLEEYGYRLGRAWGVGLGDVDNGAILFVAPNEPAGRRGPRLEVGRGLEPILTDAWSGVMIREAMIPRLRGGDLPGAMTAGADAVVAQLRAAPEEQKARTDAAAAAFDREHRRTRTGGGDGNAAGLIFWAVVMGGVFVAMAIGRRRGGGAGGGKRFRSDRRGGGVDPTLPIVLWGIANEIGRSRGGGGFGGFGGGGGSGGSGGGWGDGGFSGGGGGDFGGGGASGDW